MSTAKALNCHEKWQMYQKMIQERKACAMCAPIIVHEFLEDETNLSFERRCDFCKRKHRFQRKAFGLFERPNGEKYAEFHVC